MEGLTLLAFCCVLVGCIILHGSLVAALAVGLFIFLSYGKAKGHSLRALCGMCLSGVRSARNILINVLLIGILTALWRASGAIPVIVSWASRLIRPSDYLLMTFLLCGAISTLTGTALGSAATMGVICATMGRSLGIDGSLIGGAVLSGIFVGDRCSPVSTSALLVAELTGTDIYDNIRRMLRTAFFPALAAAFLYAVLGHRYAGAGEIPDLGSVFAAEFRLLPVCVLPALTILVLSALRVPVKRAMLCSIAVSLPLALFVQHIAPASLARMAVFGFAAGDARAAELIDGGGILSMLRVFCIVCLSSAYAGIFRKTGLLDGETRLLRRLAARTNPYAAALVTSLPASMIACNQTLTVMLTHQLCSGFYEDRKALAIDLEDSAIIVAPLIPWSIAGGAPLSAIGAPHSALLFAFYLYLLPLARLAFSFRAQKREKEGFA